MLLYQPRSFHFSVSLSLGTFIKHFVRASDLKPTAITRRSATTKSSTFSASHFETLNPLQKQQVQLYVDALLDWNQKMNLTAVRDANDVMDRHIEDSLAIIPPIQNSYVLSCGSSMEKLNLVDVGSGAGLPGLILAIACPDWKVTLLESLNKRCVFLEHVVGLIGLSNVKVVRGRAEDVGQNLEFREVFDVAVARAVAEMRILAEYCLPLVRVGGLFVAAKGHSPEAEVKRAKKAISLMGASLLQTCYGCGEFKGVLGFPAEVLPKKNDAHLQLLENEFLSTTQKRSFVAAVQGWPSQPTLREFENLMASQEALAKQVAMPG